MLGIPITNKKGKGTDVLKVWGKEVKDKDLQ